MFVDSDHAGDYVSCRSRSGFFIYMNTVLLQWFSEKQTTVETSVFVAEFVAMKSGIDALRALRHMIWMMGSPIFNPSYIYGNSIFVVHNTSRSESV